MLHNIKGLFLDTKTLFLNLTKYFNFFNTKAILGCRWLDNFSNHIFFHPCNHSSLSSYKSYLEFLDYLYLKVSSFSTLIVITDTSTIPSRNIQTISTVYFQKLEQQILVFKVLANQTTALDAELFTIRLDIAKTAIIDIECIILITDSLDSAENAVDPSVHSGQAHF